MKLHRNHTANQRPGRLARIHNVWVTMLLDPGIPYADVPFPRHDA